MFNSVIEKKLGLCLKDKDYRRAYLVFSILTLSIVTLTFYIFYNLLVTKLYQVVFLEIISLTFILFAWYVLSERKNISLASTILIGTVYTLTLLFIYDQKHHDYALIQAMILPVIAIYLKGLRVGSIWSISYIFLVLLIASSGINSWEPAPYTVTSFTNVAFTFMIILMGISYYEFSRREAFEIINKANAELHDYKNNLEEKVKKALAEKMQHQEILVQQSKMAMMGEMIASIAHQWKQPLAITSSIIHSAQLANQLQDKQDNETDEVYEKVLTQVKYMNQTITDFSSFFKPTRVKENFSLNQVIHNTKEIAEYQLTRHNILLSTEGITQDYIIDGYANEFSQVLLNLITNAKDAITSHIKENNLDVLQGKIELRAESEGEHIHLYICDNGGGIDDEHIDAIFDSYFTTKGNDAGTGIGLYMSKMIIETHMHGSINVNNTDKGACFHIRLNASSPTQTKSSETPGSSMNAPSPYLENSPSLQDAR